MPKQPNSKPKSKVKPKAKQKPKVTEAPGITTSKTYWIVLVVIMAVFVSILGAVSGLELAQIAALDIAVAVAIALVGYLRVTPSKLSISKRATFIFAGTSIIGFGIWALVSLLITAGGGLMQLGELLGGQLFIVASLAICLSLGAFAGELIGQNRRVQERLFPPKMDN
ncbi:MAG: hypothetical protein NWE93_01935 [Candidatus Bathyarchaeota archaeon]|nr:hypothetical protein [Candidatus Bathyarchaeota archaeon]